MLEQGKQQRPVDAVEEIGDIELQVETRRLAPGMQRPHEPLETVDSGMNALAPAVGVDIVDEDRLVQGLKPGHQPVVHHPVGVGRGMDLASLGPADTKANRGGRLPSSRGQRLHSGHQVVQHPGLVPLRLRGSAFPPAAQPPGGVQGAEIGNRRPLTFRNAPTARGGCCRGCCCWRCH